MDRRPRQTPVARSLAGLDDAAPSVGLIGLCSAAILLAAAVFTTASDFFLAVSAVSLLPAAIATVKRDFAIGLPGLIVGICLVFVLMGKPQTPPASPERNTTHGPQTFKRHIWLHSHSPKLPKANPGFTLIELSIVLVVIGLIIGGILVGRDLIHAAEIRKTIKQTEQLDAAVNTFRTKFNCVPGDCANAWAFGFTDYNAHAVIPNAASHQNGNGDGMIFKGTPPNHMSEVWNALWWLSNAGLIQVPGTMALINGAQYPYTTSIPAALGGSRSSNIYGFSYTTGITWHLAYMDTTTADYLADSNYGANNQYFSHPGHYYWLSGEADQQIFAEAITPADAYAIDSKMDDGLPRSGKVLASGNDSIDNDDFLNLVPVFDPTDFTETGPAGANSHFCITNDTTPLYNVQNTLRDGGWDNGGGVGSLCTLTVQAAF